MKELYLEEVGCGAHGAYCMAFAPLWMVDMGQIDELVLLVLPEKWRSVRRNR